MGKTLNEYMGWCGPITHRQHRMYEEFFRQEMNNPSLTDHYLMDFHTTVARMFAKHPERIKLEHQKLVFGIPKPKTKEEIQKEIEWSKQTMLASFGGMKGVNVLDKDGNILKAAESIRTSGHAQKLKQQRQGTPPPVQRKPSKRRR